MFKPFFLSRQWWRWAVLGGAVILYVTWYKVQISVDINDWYGSFYDLIQKALAKPNAVTIEDFNEGMFGVFCIFTIWILVRSGIAFFARHYVFRWRTAMNNYYMSYWPKLRHIEGAAQRVQEDTNRFATIVQSLGVSFVDAILTLIAFHLFCIY